jgi:hypothetical protein
MNKPNLSFYVTIGLIIITAIYLIVSKKKLHKNGILLNAKTTNWAPGAKVSLDLKYEFYYKGEKKIGADAFNDFRGNPDFVGRYFPVIYYPGWGGHNQLLITPSDFKEFNLPFPDSLNWVLPYIGE